MSDDKHRAESDVEVKADGVPGRLRLAGSGVHVARSCNSCRFYSPLKQECRVEPPKAQLTNNGMITYFPIIPPTEWCGRFDPVRN